GGTSDAFVAELSAAGTALLYSSYLGGNYTDIGHAIAVNASTGSAYVAGESNSSTLRTVNALQSALGSIYSSMPDGFVAMFTPGVTVGNTPPAAPTNLTAVAASSTQINLTWTDNSNNETAFAVWRTGGGSAFARVAALAANSTSYTDRGLTPNTPYTYAVRAINNVGASAWSNQVMVTTPP